MDLVRTRKTGTVHRPDCRSRGVNSRTWEYAADMTLEQVSRKTEGLGWLHLCGTCLKGLCRCRRCKARSKEG